MADHVGEKSAPMAAPHSSHRPAQGLSPPFQLPCKQNDSWRFLGPRNNRQGMGAWGTGSLVLFLTTIKEGRKVLERSWERPILGIELTGALSDLSWGGWKLVASSYVSSNTHKLLDSHPARTLELLAALQREKRLSDMDIVWKQRFQTWVEKTFASWEHTEQNVRIHRFRPLGTYVTHRLLDSNVRTCARAVEFAASPAQTFGVYHWRDATGRGAAFGIRDDIR